MLLRAGDTQGTNQAVSREADAFHGPVLPQLGTATIEGILPMRVNGKGLKRLTLAVCLGAGMASGCGTAEPGSAEPSRTGSERTMRDALEAGVDFAVTSVSAPSAVLQGAQFTASVTVCNRGMQDAQTTVDLLLSSDDVASGDDAVVQVLDPGALPAGACRVMDVPANAWVAEGTYHLLAVADRQQLTPEASEANNVHDAGLFGVGFLPDFTVAAVSGPPAAQSWDVFTASVTVCNRGTMERDTSVALILSADAEISQADTFIAGQPTGLLAPGQCETLSLQGSAMGLPDGAYHLGALVTNWGGQQELTDSNNALSGGLIGIGPAADFVIPSVTAPASTPPGMPFFATVNVCNQGLVAASGSVEVSVVSGPEVMPVSPSASVPAFLSPGQCVAQDVWVDTGGLPTGAWFVRATASANGSPEFITSNNTAHSGAIGIGDGSDFIVSDITVPASVQPGQQFTASVTVCNQGTRDEDVDVALFLVSAPEEEPANAVAGQYLGWIPAGQCVTQDVWLTADAMAMGRRFVRATVDLNGFRHELIESNNTRDSGAVNVQF